MLEGFDGADVLFADSDDEMSPVGQAEARRSSVKQGGGAGEEPLTPPLSLPDSFDEGEYFPPPNSRAGGSRAPGRHGDNEGGGGGGGGSYKEVSRLQSLLAERNEKFRDLNIRCVPASAPVPLCVLAFLLMCLSSHHADTLY